MRLGGGGGFIKEVGEGLMIWWDLVDLLLVKKNLNCVEVLYELWILEELIMCEAGNDIVGKARRVRDSR